MLIMATAASEVFHMIGQGHVRLAMI